MFRFSGWSFDALSSVRCFPDFPNPFSYANLLPPNLVTQTQKLLHKSFLMLAGLHFNAFEGMIRISFVQMQKRC